MRMVIVSNRLPIILDRSEDTWAVRAASGGLVTALSQLLREHGGVWIGWPGTVGADANALAPVLDRESRSLGYDLIPVALTAEERDGFYHGFSNEIIWPLFHDLQTRCNFVPDYWASYHQVLHKFAEACSRGITPGDLVWVHDYHLNGLGQRLREAGLTNSLGFFLHIPFPPPDIFAKLPWRDEVLRSLLWYDLVGVQTPRDRDNLLDCLRRLLPRISIRRGQGLHTATYAGRSTRIGVFPIGIDAAEFESSAGVSEIPERVGIIRQQLTGKNIILGVDRLDYTKGIPYRLRAFRRALERFPDLHLKVTFLQVVVPSREAVPEYQDLKAEIERLVAQVNGEFTQTGWVPVHYLFKEVERSELLSYYRAADVALITPLKDGMNLVAKEYCACNLDGDGVLILSEFAGAAVQLRHSAMLVNPYDLDGVAEAIYRAVHTTKRERARAMRRMRAIIKREDVYWWADRFLAACGAPSRAVTQPPGGPEEDESSIVKATGQ